jgi:hypothetical protein
MARMNPQKLTTTAAGTHMLFRTGRDLDYVFFATRTIAGRSSRPFSL